MTILSYKRIAKLNIKLLAHSALGVIKISATILVHWADRWIWFESDWLSPMKWSSILRYKRIAKLNIKLLAHSALILIEKSSTL